MSFPLTEVQPGIRLAGGCVTEGEGAGAVIAAELVVVLAVVSPRRILRYGARESRSGSRCTNSVRCR